MPVINTVLKHIRNLGVAKSASGKSGGAGSPVSQALPVATSLGKRHLAATVCHLGTVPTATCRKLEDGQHILRTSQVLVLIAHTTVVLSGSPRPSITAAPRRDR